LLDKTKSHKINTSSWFSQLRNDRQGTMGCSVDHLFPTYTSTKRKKNIFIKTGVTGVTMLPTLFYKGFLVYRRLHWYTAIY